MAVALGEMPGVAVNFTQPMAMRLDEVVSGVKADVAVKIFGEDSATLERLAGEVEGVRAAVRCRHVRRRRTGPPDKGYHVLTIEKGLATWKAMRS